MKEEKNYQVGPLLYCPANQHNIATSIISNRFGTGYSLCLCLEDTINDKFVSEAEQTMINSLHTIAEARPTCDFYLPKIFIRVRNPCQIVKLINAMGDLKKLIYGFNIPKFNLQNFNGYRIALEDAICYKPDLMFMPIIESPDMANMRKRVDFLCNLKDSIRAYEQYILNIRVGGNDISHLYGLRRNWTQTIYDVKPVASALTDILSVFATDYVVSGPVFEYYNGPYYADSLARECSLDVAAGFIGKTAIHPNQLPIIKEALKVTKEDYDDAKAIMGWDMNASFVAGSSQKNRMNEVKTHTNWAKRTIALGDYYGVKDI